MNIKSRRQSKYESTPNFDVKKDVVRTRDVRTTIYDAYYKGEVSGKPQKDFQESLVEFENCRMGKGIDSERLERK